MDTYREQPLWTVTLSIVHGQPTGDFLRSQCPEFSPHQQICVSELKSSQQFWATILRDSPWRHQLKETVSRPCRPRRWSSMSAEVCSTIVDMQIATVISSEADWSEQPPFSAAWCSFRVFRFQRAASRCGERLPKPRSSISIIGQNTFERGNHPKISEICTGTSFSYSIQDIFWNICGKIQGYTRVAALARIGERSLQTNIGLSTAAARIHNCFTIYGLIFNICYISSSPAHRINGHLMNVVRFEMMIILLRNSQRHA